MRCHLPSRPSLLALGAITAFLLGSGHLWGQESSPPPDSTKATESSQVPEADPGDQTGRNAAVDPDLAERLAREALQRQIADQIRQIGKKTEQIEKQIEDLEELKELLESLQTQLAALAEPADDQEPKSKDDLAREIGIVNGWRAVKVSIKDAMTVSTKDGRFSFVGGVRYQIDATNGSQGSDLDAIAGPIDTGLAIRRLRLWAEGIAFSDYRFVANYDLGTDSGPKDTYIKGLLHRVLKHKAEFTLGLIREPIGLEEMTSSQFISFLERSAPLEALVPGRNFGWLFTNRSAWSKRWTWAVGNFTNISSFNEKSGASNFVLTARGTGLALWQDGGEKLVHLGLAYSVRSPKDNSVRYRTHPEARFAGYYIDTDVIVADSNQLLGLELALVNGPWWAQAEWLGSNLQTDDLVDPTFDGWYVQLGRFITGERRPYMRAFGTFGRVIPRANYEKGRGPGAWEVGLRYSDTDLNSGVIQGGRLQDITLGINWHVTPYTKLMFNYINANRVDTGRGNFFLLRFEYDGR